MKINYELCKLLLLFFMALLFVSYYEYEVSYYMKLNERLDRIESMIKTELYEDLSALQDAVYDFSLTQKEGKNV